MTSAYALEEGRRAANGVRARSFGWGRRMQIHTFTGQRPYTEVGLRFPVEVNLRGESVKSDPEAAKRRETGGACKIVWGPPAAHAANHPCAPASG